MIVRSQVDCILFVKMTEIRPDPILQSFLTGCGLMCIKELLTCTVYLCLTSVCVYDRQHGAYLLSQHCLAVSGSVTLGVTALRLMIEKDH